MAVRKQWYDIIAPEIFENRVVGETLAADPKQLVGRVIDASLIDVSDNYQKFYVKVRLKIMNVEGNKAHTKLVGHDMLKERVYRMVQRHGRRVDAIQDVTTKDGVKLRIKTVFMLIKRVGATKKDATRKLTRQLIEEAAGKHNFDDLMNAIISGDLQHKVRKEASKVYPVGGIEIRRTELVKERVAAA